MDTGPLYGSYIFLFLLITSVLLLIPADFVVVMADDCCHILHIAAAHLWVVPIEDLMKGRAFRGMLIDQSEEVFN